jgi:hypothetical protein
MGQYDRIDAEFPDPARDKLLILSSEIKYYDSLPRHIPSEQAKKQSAAASLPQLYSEPPSVLHLLFRQAGMKVRFVNAQRFPAAALIK